MLSDPRLSSDISKPGYPKVLPGLAYFGEGHLDHMDPPEHDVYRRMLAPSFMVKRVERLRTEVEGVVNGLIDEMVAKGPPVDLVTALAIGLPGTITCALLGVPYAEREFYVRCVETFTGGLASVDEIKAARQELHALLAALVESKLASPSDDDDLISRMVREFVEPGEITAEQLIDFAVLVLTAGFDTTWNMLAIGTLTLLNDPEQLALFRRDPALAPNVVEELLRYLTVPQLGRVKAATARVEIGGQVIEAGEGIVASMAAANWDPSVFPNPETLDVRRVFNRHHLAFGHGIHQCLGAALTRLELQVAFTLLFERLPGLEIAVPFEALSFKDESFVYGVRELPVRW